MHKVTQQVRGRAGSQAQRMWLPILIKANVPGPEGQGGKAMVSVRAGTSKAAGTEGPAPPHWPGRGPEPQKPRRALSHLPPHWHCQPLTAFPGRWACCLYLHTPSNAELIPSWPPVPSLLCSAWEKPPLPYLVNPIPAGVWCCRPPNPLVPLLWTAPGVSLTSPDPVGFSELRRL